MAVKIRLMRIGAKKRPFYRVIAVDERKKRTGSYIELLGTYNPLTEPKEIILKQDRINWWQEHGAVLSDGFLRITKQAPQKPPRKPKKEKEVKEPAAPVETPEPAAEAAAEEVLATEAPSTDVAAEETPAAETVSENAQPEEEKSE